MAYRESEVSWLEILLQLKFQAISIAPEFAIGDGAFGFWSAVTKHWSITHPQHFWVHKTANVLNKVPKSVQPIMKETLQDIYMAETQQEAHKAFGQFEIRYGAKYPKAAECLIRNKVKMLVFYDVTAKRWTHIRMTNPIELIFTTVRLRTHKIKNYGNQKTTLVMALKLMRTAEVNWRKLRGFKLLADIIKGVKFRDGIRETNVNHQDTDLEAVH